MTDLWSSADAAAWRGALASYPEVLARRGVERLPELDRWYREEFPGAVAARDPAHLTREELARVTEWKMKRGVWRARNLALVKGNDPDAVVAASTAALAALPDPRRPIVELTRLAGVGPATASAVAAAAAPGVYPFFDELVAVQVPGLGPVAFTAGYYHRYAEALRERARRLSPPWTPAEVAHALWANAGGKAGLLAS